MMLFPLLYSLIFLYPHLSLSYENPRQYLCGDTNYYTSNSSFSDNLGWALQALRNTTASTGFSTTTTGNHRVQVTALALCRATIAPSDCQQCVDAASSGIRSVCPDQTAAQVWYTLCFLRYSSDNFVNITDDQIAFRLYDVRRAPDPDVYDAKVKMLMQNLSSTAGVSEKRYAVGRTAVPENQTLYGYVECTRDVDGDSCKRCLLTAIASIDSCCLGQWAGWIATPTCDLQFNMDPVHADWFNAPYINTNVIQTPAPGSPFILVSPPATEPVVVAADKGGGGGGLVIKISVILAVGIVVLIVVGLCVVIQWRKRDKGVKGSSGIEAKDCEEILSEDVGMGSFIYDLGVLVSATDGFSLENQIGTGGFGSVYKGILANGEEIAVKKLAPGSTHGSKGFSNEVRLLLKLQHRNLIQLFGCCVEGEHRMLVYEYLHNKSLDYFLFDKSKSSLLDWPKRYNIILGVARGLFYLHEDSQYRIIHGDIKASNILLDKEMNPKISDFGLAKLVEDEQSHHQTRCIAGTFGYMAPEYALRGVMSAKMDVFSFGVLTLEIISGRKNYDLRFDEQNPDLLKLARRLEKEGRLTELVDETISSFPRDVALKCIRIGLLCCQESTQDRPTMSYVVEVLSDDSVTIPIPVWHGYQEALESNNSIYYSACSMSESFSMNSKIISNLADYKLH